MSKVHLAGVSHWGANIYLPPNIFQGLLSTLFWIYWMEQIYGGSPTINLNVIIFPVVFSTCIGNINNCM